MKDKTRRNESSNYAAERSSLLPGLGACSGYISIFLCEENQQGCTVPNRHPLGTYNRLKEDKGGERKVDELINIQK